MNKTYYWTGTSMQIFQFLIIVIIALTILPINWSWTAKFLAIGSAIIVWLLYNILSFILIRVGMKKEVQY